MSVRLYIGNLPKDEIDKSELQAVFAQEGDAVTTKLIKDRKTGKCRGFGFLTVNDDEQADQMIEKYNGHIFKETPIKLEKALPRSKGNDENEEQPQAQAQAAPTKVNNSPAGGGSGNSKKNKKSRRGGGNAKESAAPASSSDAVRPDPRWANELEKLKEMLAAQTTN